MRVVVVGAGVFGAWTALWLRRRGASVQLVDQYGAGNSLASSGDESRVTRSAHGPDDHYPLWQRHALAEWRRLEEATGEALFVETGVAWFAHRDDGFEADSLATLERLRIPVQRWSRDELVRRMPHVTAGDLTWALYEPEGGALMARRAVAATAEQLVREGGELIRGRAVPPEAGDRGPATVRLADGRFLEADAIVFAAGPWLPRLLSDLRGLELSVPQQEVIYVATPPGDLRFDAGSHPTWVDYDRSFYGIPSIEGRGFKIAPDWPGPQVDPDGQERRLSDERVAAARAFLAERFPDLAAQPVAEGRVCQYELTADTHFVIDRHPAWPNAWVVGGGSGHGFKHGPAVGEYASALVMGDDAASANLAPPDYRFALGPRTPGIGLRTAARAPDEVARVSG
jgi:glycine/D-amino acid oxidase-like deaminating enzyme